MKDESRQDLKWLGIARSNPNHYELLGLERDESDVFRIKSAAEAKLRLIKDAGAEVSMELRKELAARVKVAYSVLASSKRRQTYDAEFLAHQPKIARPVAPLPSSTPATPMMAIALPQQSKSLPTIIPSAVLAAADSRNPNDSSSMHGEHTPSLEGDVSIRVRRPRLRKTSRLATNLIAATILIAGPAIVFGLVYYNWKSLSEGGIGKNLTQAAGNSHSNESADLETTPTTESTPAVDHQPSDSARADTATADLNDGTNDNDPSTPSIASPNAEQTTNDDSDPPLVADESTTSDQDSETVESPDPAATLTGEQMRTVRLFWADLRCRDVARARSRLTLLNQNTTDLSGAALPKALQEAAALTAEFWSQLVRSCASQSSGIELQFDGEEIGFVESTDQYVMFKIKGINAKAFFETLPVPVAIELAEKGTIADIPRWRLCKAVALMFTPEMAGASESTIRELLAQSADDGHETASLELLLMLHPRLALRENTRDPLPDENQRKQAIKLADEVLRPKQFERNNVAGMRREAESAIAAAHQQQDRLTKLGLYDRALQSAVRLCDIHFANEILLTVAELYEFDHDDEMLAAVKRMVPNVLRADQAERVADAILHYSGHGWPTLVGGSANRRELIDAEKLANRYKIKTLQDRIEFLLKQQ